MIVIPAIDLLGGECVRLVKGEYGTAGRTADDPLKVAKYFKDCGAEYIHIVDLDGAKNGVKSKQNRKIAYEIAAKFDIPTELGGGIRTLADMEECIENGISRVILGSAAVDFNFLQRAIDKFGDRTAVGADAKNGKAAVNGWTESSNLDCFEFISDVTKMGVKNVIFTDISTDGTLSHPNFAALDKIRSLTDADITASGGIADIGDIRRLANMGLYGAICGKSIYAGTLDLAQAIKEGKEIK